MAWTDTYPGTAPHPTPQAPTPTSVQALRVAAIVRVVLAGVAIAVTAANIGFVWLDAGSYGAQLGWTGALDLTGSTYPAVAPVVATVGCLGLVGWVVAAVLALGPKRRGAAAVGLLSALTVLGAVATAVFTVLSSWYRVTDAGPLLLVTSALLLALVDLVVVGLLLTPGRRAWARAVRTGGGTGVAGAGRAGSPPPGWPPAG